MAYDFNGSNQYLSGGTGFPFNFGPGDYTVSCLINFVSFSNNPVFFDTRTSVSGLGLALYAPSSGTPILYIAGNAITGSPVATGTTHSILASRLSGQHQLYVNGSSNGTSSMAANFVDTGLLIGTAFDHVSLNTFKMNGTVAEVAVWNAALTADEIRALNSRFTPDQIRPQSLQFYAPLVRNLQDVRAGRTITNINGATAAIHPRIIK